MRGHNMCFHWEIRKITFELSSVLPLIWSCFVSFCTEIEWIRFQESCPAIFCFASLFKGGHLKEFASLEMILAFRELNRKSLVFFFWSVWGGGRVVQWCFITFSAGMCYNLDNIRVRAYCACSRCGRGCSDNFSLFYHLWETAQYRL